MASLLEGGGKTPMVPLSELQMMGFKLVAYPLSLLGVSINAMRSALEVRTHHCVGCADAQQLRYLGPASLAVNGAKRTIICVSRRPL